ncbi:MAG: hypothetical protein ACI8ZM_000015 [Crocinitomix sp.]|jgi:hypothetical protein
MRLIFLLICFAINNQLNAKSVGWKYHDFIRKADALIYHEDKVNFDSVFYYYDQALGTGSESYGDDIDFITHAIWYGYYRRAKRYLLIGAAKELTWKEAKQSMVLAKCYLWKSDARFNEYLTHKSRIVDVCSRAEFDAVYDSITRPTLNKEVIKLLDKADRINNRSKQRAVDDLIERDYKGYYPLFKVVVLTERIPTVAEVGIRGHGIIERVIQQCSAIQILILLPFLLEAIHDGAYLYNESLAEAINRCAIYDGEFIVLKQGNFMIEKDTLYGAEKWGNYSYLGLDYTRNKLDFIEERYLQPLRHTDITIDQVNIMRDTLCLDSIQTHLELNNVKQLNRFLFEENLDSLNAGK